jgi:2,3-bisphosphoglycerate-dependent phosphoglycerate mutase
MHSDPCLILIRHAQSENNALADHLRVPDPNITTLGVLQAAKLAVAVQRLVPTVLYSSPFLRSMETMRPIATATGILPHVRQDIYEQGGCHSGHLVSNRIAQKGMSRTTIAANYYNWKQDDRIDESGWYDLRHYESRQEASDRARRVRAWFEQDERSHTRLDRVAMVIHADFKLRLLEAFLEDETIERKLGEVINTSITCLSRVTGKWRMDYWNVFSHLDADEVSA